MVLFVKEDNPFKKLEKRLHNLFKEAIAKNVFPGAEVGITIGRPLERRIFMSHYGNRTLFPSPLPLNINTCFDLASLTKPFATTLSILCLIKQNKIRIDEKLESIFPDIPSDKKGITIKQLLDHSAGFPDYREYFKEVAKKEKNKRKKLLKRLIFQEELHEKPGKKQVYSDIGFILLGFIIELLSGKEIDTFFKESIVKPLGLEKGIFYQRNKNIGKEQEALFAATELCPWRKRIIVGQVHDENTYAIEGVSGQAGLFGDIESVLLFTTEILDQWQGRTSHPNYLNTDLHIFLQKEKDQQGTRVLGFDTPDTEGSSAGRYFSKKSVGHLGFTGTSFWIDPERYLIVVLLTNRIHPTRENKKIQDFRPLFHDSIVEELNLT